MDIVRIILIGLIIFFTVSTYLSCINKPYWFLRVFDFPLVSYSFSLMVISLTYIIAYENVFQDWSLVMMIGATIALIIAGFKLYRYFPFVRKSAFSAQEDDPKRQVSILNANVRQKNHKHDQLKELLAGLQPDIVIMHEANQRWHEQMAYLKKEYPYHVLVPQENTYGMLFYSRLALESHSVEFLCEEGVPSIHAVVVLPNKEKFKLYAVHPKPPEVGSHTHDRDTEIVLIGKMIGKDPMPAVMSGDLNDVPWSKALVLFRKLSNVADPRRGRGFYNTFNAKFPFFRYPLDFVNFTGHFRLVEMRREKYIHSDHFPLYVKLSFEPDGYHENLYELVDEERQDAREIIQQKNRTVFPEPGVPRIDEW